MENATQPSRRVVAMLVDAASVSAVVADATPALAMLRWDDGTRHAVYARTLFGRNPGPAPGALVVPVRDETLSVSKTHFEIGRDDRGVWVADRSSTNGVVVVRHGLRRALVPEERVLVRAGDVLEVGDRRVTLEGVR